MDILAGVIRLYVVYNIDNSAVYVGIQPISLYIFLIISRRYTEFQLLQASGGKNKVPLAS